MHEIEDNTPPDVKLGHEMRDISTRVVVIFGISLVVGAALVFVAIWLVYLFLGAQADRVYATREYPLAPVGAPAQPPAPRLQTQPREELKALRAAEDQRLSGYGWVNPSAGVAYIPIERAMQLTLEQGLPVRGDAGAFRPGYRPERSSSGRTAGVSEKQP
jgi:hypothetical protein